MVEDMVHFMAGQAKEMLGAAVLFVGFLNQGARDALP
jgi:hypothetical protein